MLNERTNLLHPWGARSAPQIIPFLFPRATFRGATSAGDPPRPLLDSHRRAARMQKIGSFIEHLVIGFYE